jgi:hypothetical protein
VTTAVVTGFTVHEPLMRKSFAPLLNLRRTGVLGRILYMTWDTAAIDAYVAPALEWPEVELVRIPQPDVTGTPHRRGFQYQSRNLAAVLKLVSDPDELVFKTRPDYLIDEAFLADKIASFDTWRTAPDFSHRIPPILPPSPFQARIWLPWADATPFFFEDAAFMGLAGDLARLCDPVADQLIQYCGDDCSVNVAHVLRFAVPFLEDYPIFLRYVRDFQLFRMELRYRRKTAPLFVNDPFFWHLAVANAWILANNFHVDCGHKGQLHMIESSTAQEGLGKPVEELCDHVVYRDVEIWRAAEEPGTFLPLLNCAGTRLMDDDWQTRLFSGPVEQGFTHENLLLILENLTRYRSGILRNLEETFYGALTALYKEFPNQAACPGS